MISPLDEGLEMGWEWDIYGRRIYIYISINQLTNLMEE